jgi:hypothetical protein
VPGGDGAAAAALATTERAEVVMKNLERRPRADPERDRLLGELADLVREHVRTTETELFPALRAARGPAELEQLAGVAELAKRTAPTRPHPGAPHEPPWNLIVTPGLGLVDKVRDALSRRATRPERL